MPLNDAICKNAKPTEKARKLADGHGMYLEVMPTGRKYWRLKYRYLGKEKRLALGVYPETTLLEAREKRAIARKQLADGLDPMAEKKKDKRVAKLNAENNFEAIAREWHTMKMGEWTPSYGKNVLIRLEQDIFPEIGAIPVKEITPPDMLQTIRKIEKRGALEISKRLNQTCGQIFRYAIATGRCIYNPCTDLKGALKVATKTHYACIEINEIPELLAKLNRNDARLYPHTLNAIKLMMLTFVRTSELINAKWAEFDFKEKQWIIPAERMKMRQQHIVPLSRQALEILEQLKQYHNEWGWVFPSQIAARKSMSNNTILKALERMGYKGKMTGHGFRALAMSTIKEKLHYRHEVVDRQLAHAPKNSIQAAYDRAKFLDERAVMMQHWADYLDGLKG